jgi:ABC-type multidrug transport system fused ATPase/permease subunit
MMDRSSPYYGIGIIIVSTITFLFVFFVFPYLHPLVVMFIFIGMLILMVISFFIGNRRKRAISQELETGELVTETEQYIMQIDEIMRKK